MTVVWCEWLSHVLFGGTYGWVGVTVPLWGEPIPSGPLSHRLGSSEAVPLGLRVWGRRAPPLWQGVK